MNWGKGLHGMLCAMATGATLNDFSYGVWWDAIMWTGWGVVLMTGFLCEQKGK